MNFTKNKNIFNIKLIEIIVFIFVVNLNSVLCKYLLEPSPLIRDGENSDSNNNIDHDTRPTIKSVYNELVANSSIHNLNPAYVINTQSTDLPHIVLAQMTAATPNTSISNLTLTALANFKGDLDPDLVASINPFWLQFPPQSPQAHYTLGIIYAIMMVLGFSGNLLVIFMFIKCKSLRTPANTLVINLAVSDFLMVSEIPVFIYNSFNEGPAFSSTGCSIYGFVGALTGTLSIATLTFISVDRYNVVVYPLDPLRSTTKWRSRIMVIIAWVYSLFWSCVPLFPQWGFSKYSPEGFLTACSFDYLSDIEKERWFMFCYFIFAWVVPFTLISYCYIHILRVVIGANSIQSSKDKNKTEIKLAAIVMAVIGLWFTAWTPYALVALFGISGNKHKLSPLGSMVPAMFAKTAAIIDPYVYAVTHPRFRLEFGKMFLGHVDARQSQFQTSYTKTTAGRRRGTTDENVAMDDRPRTKRGPLERGASSLCDDSEVSLSIDLSDSAMPPNDEPRT